MKYPALWAAVFAGAGVVSTGTVSADSLILHLAFGGGGLLLLSVAFFVFGRRARVKRIPNLSSLYFLFAATLSVYTASTLNSLAVSSSNPRDISRWTDTRVILPATITGRLRRQLVGSSGSRKYEIDISSITTAAARRTAEGRVLYEVPAYGTSSSGAKASREVRPFHSGDEVCVTGSVSALPAGRNAFDFDAKTYYRRLGISAIFEPPAVRSTTRVSPALCDGLVLVRHRHGGVLYFIERIRTSIRNRMLKTHRSSASHQLLPALLLGDRSLVDYSSREAFRSSGLSHLLAISGLHVGILGMTLYWMLGIWLDGIRFSYAHRQSIRAFITFIALLTFAAISGGSPSVQRAVAMTSVFLLGAAVGRKAVGWNGFGVAAVVVIGLGPQAVFSAGFQLSFAAVAGIFLWLNSAPLLSGGMTEPSLLRTAFKTIEISGAIFCSTLPVLLYHFGAAPLIGLLLNVPAIPLTALLLYSSVLSTIIGSGLTVLGPSIATTTDLLATALIGVAELFSGVGDHSTLTSATETLSSLHFIPLLILWMSKSKRRSEAVLKFLAFAVFTLLFVRSDSRHVSVTFLDVGQGDAAVVITPSKKTIVIDTGGGRSSALALTRHLSSTGSQRIDMLVVTHFHRDHSGGMSYLLKKYAVGSLVISNGSGGSLDDPGLSQLLTSSLLKEVGRGDVLDIDPSVRLHVLAPRKKPGSSRSTNESSLVLKLTYGNTSFLLTGDAENDAETDLVTSYGRALNSNIVKVPHHGSSTSSGLPFVLRTSEKLPTVVVSVSRKNRFKHPDPKVILRWRNAGSEVLLTSVVGGISFISDGFSVTRKDWRLPGTT